MGFFRRPLSPRVRGGAGCDEPRWSSSLATTFQGLVRRFSGLQSNPEAYPPLRPAPPAHVGPRWRERRRRCECPATRGRLDRGQGPARSRRRGAADHRDTGATRPRRRFGRAGSDTRCAPSASHGDWSGCRSTIHRTGSGERNERQNGSSGLDSNGTSFFVAIARCEHYPNRLSRVKREMLILSIFCIYSESFLD